LILNYIKETAREFDIEPKIRLNHRVVSASWDSGHARWTVRIQRADMAEPISLTCSFLFLCTGYYRYDAGYLPVFPGVENFAGPVIHPQHWPKDLDYNGKRVVVIGSGATAVTLVPAMAETAAHVTMLQRSPTYVISMPSRDVIANRLRQWLPNAVYPIMRWKNALQQQASFLLSRRCPQLVRWLLRKAAIKQLPPGYDVDTHFAPNYKPWDQRLCLIPDGDLFHAIKRGRASIVTDHIETFTEHAIQLRSGVELDADIIVTATGLNVLAFGGIELAVDGEPVTLRETVAYKGMMICGVPNFAWTFGYINASWTLKAELIAQYVCRLLRHMDSHGYSTVTPVSPETSSVEPMIDLSAGYIRRSVDILPKQGPAAPWRLHQNYLRDVRLLCHGPVTDNVLFTRRHPAKHPVNTVASP